MWNRFLSWPAVVLCLLIMVAAVIANRPCQYKDIGNSATAQVLSPSTKAAGSVGALAPSVQYRIGGWPLRYYVANLYARRPAAVHFSLWRLLGNIAFFTAIVGFLVLYESRALRGPKKVASSSKLSSARQFSVSDLVLLITLVALAAGYWQALGMRATAERQRIAQGSGRILQAQFSALVPEWLHERLTPAMVERFMRVREIALDNPDDEAVRLALSFDSLRSLSIGGGQYDLRLLDKLCKMPLLNDLRISGRKLDNQAVTAIGSCKQLQSLNLMRTNITAQGLEAMGEMPRLQVLNVMHTDVELAKLGRPPMAESLTDLMLPHPDHGRGDELILEQWPFLATLQISEYDTQSNREPVKVTLRDCPVLRRLGLDRFQLFDLTLEQLPNFRGIDVLAHQAPLRSKKIDPPMTDAWLSGLTIRDSSLREPLSFQPQALKRLDVDSQLPVNLQLGKPNPQATPSNRIYQELFDQLERCQGISELHLGDLMLSGVDFTPLSKMQSLTKLDLAGAKFATSELHKLHNPKLVELILWQNQLLTTEIESLIKNLPNLEVLGLDIVSLDMVALENSTLKEFRRSPSSGSSLGVHLGSDGSGIQGQARLVKVPNLACEANFYLPLKSVWVEQAPRLTRLHFYQPLPPGSTIKGLRDLESFGAGGNEFTPEHLDAVLKCPKLKTLSLLYTSLSPESLKQLNQLTELTCLALSGSSVTDEVLASWTNLKSLRILRLDGTQITGKSLSNLATQFPSLWKLTIDVEATEEQLMDLGKCSRLLELSVSGATITANFVDELARLPDLRILDLTGCTLESDAVAKLTQDLLSVERIILLGAKLSDAEQGALISSARGDRFVVDDDRQVRTTRMNLSSGMRSWPQNAGTSVVIMAEDGELWSVPFREAAKKMTKRGTGRASAQPVHGSKN